MEERKNFNRRRPRSFTILLYTLDNVPSYLKHKKPDLNLETLRPDYGRYPLNQLVEDVDWDKLNSNVEPERQKTEHIEIEVLKERDESHSFWDKLMMVSVFVFSFGLGWFAAGGVKTKKKHA